MLIRVPTDVPDLASAVERAVDGDEVRIEGVVLGGVHITRAITVSGADATEQDPTRWGTVRGGGLRALVLAGPVDLRRLRVENPEGHGVRVETGAGTFEQVVVDVAETGFGVVGDAAPTVIGCTVARCNNGMLVIGTARPRVRQLRVTAAGGGLVVREQGGGRFEGLVLLTGRFAAIEAADDATPEVHGAQIHSGTGGVFVRDRARPALHEVHVNRCGLAGLEVTGSAEPTISGLRVRDAGASGLHLHGASRGTYVDVHVTEVRAAGIDVGEQAEPALEQVHVAGCTGAGLYVHGESQVEVDYLSIEATGGPAVDAHGRSRLRVDDGRLAHGGSVGVRAGEHAEVRLCRVALEGAGTRVSVHGAARVDEG